MALIQRITTRCIARVGTWVAAAVRFVLEVLRSFLGFKEGDDLSTKRKKTANLAIRRAAYFVADYYLAALSAAIVVVMKHHGFTFVWIFVVMWIFDFITAGAFIVYYKKTGKDLSLGEDLRRATDTVHNKSRIAGLLAMGGVLFLAIVWTGPERVIIYFQEEIRTPHRAIVVLLTLTAIQALIYTVVYGFGYDLVTWF